jgi:hypothetical protein
MVTADLLLAGLAGSLVLASNNVLAVYMRRARKLAGDAAQHRLPAGAVTEAQHPLHHRQPDVVPV